MEYTLKIAISLLPVCLAFFFYFRNFVFEQDVYHLSRAFFFGMLVSGVALLVQLALPETKSHILRAFFHAAFVEESLRLLVVAAMVSRSDDTFTVTEGIFRAMLVGLGFAFSENLHYALNHHGFVLLLRTVSSVPMHVFAAAAIGYCLAYARHCDIPEINDSAGKTRRRRLYLLALALPIAYHTAFDMILFTGGRVQRLLPPLLAGGFLFVEYLNARARLVVPRNVLAVLGVDADDLDIVTRQKYYEAWLKSRQAQGEPRPRLFRGHFVRFNLVLGLALITLALGGAGVLRFRPALLQLDASLDLEVLMALAVSLPGTAGLVLLAAGRLNYLFFRENLLRLPRVAMVVLRKGSERFQTVALDVLPRGVFLADVHQIKRGEQVVLEFRGRHDRLARTRGIVRWRNQEEPNVPRGCVVRYARRSPAFTFFVVTHQLKRIRTGLYLLVAGAVPTHTPSSVRRPPSEQATPQAGTPETPGAKRQVTLRLSPSLAGLCGNPGVFEERLNRALQDNPATAAHQIDLSADGDPAARTLTISRENQELLATAIPDGSCLAVAVPGFGSPADASSHARPLSLANAYLVPPEDAARVEGIGCEVFSEPADVIERLVLLTLRESSGALF